MRRIILLLLLITLAVTAAIWFSNRPGYFSMEWLDYRIETHSVGLVLLAALIFAGSVALLYRFWRFLVGAPAAVGRKWKENKRQRGYKALTQGMVAVAAGDAEEARRWSRRAEGLLNEPPLTLLLSAQSAQLKGDEGAARRYFEQMLENEDTRFLGLRGLVTQCLKEGNRAAALNYLRQAKEMRPKTPWVLTNLYELSRKEGDFEEAEQALKAARKAGALPAPKAEAQTAALSLAKALDAEEKGELTAALRFARTAMKQRLGWVAPAIVLTRLAMQEGRTREAQKTIEQAWVATPHPTLATFYKDLKPEASSLEQVKRLAKLTSRNPRHTESRLTNAQAALEAELWGEARRHLHPLIEEGLNRRACRLMARLEELEHGNRDLAREWLERSFSAQPDPVWICGDCGARHKDWSLDCTVCGAFDQIDWRQPRASEAWREEKALHIEPMTEPRQIIESA